MSSEIKIRRNNNLNDQSLFPGNHARDDVFDTTANVKRRKKSRSKRYCGCGRTIFFASAVTFFFSCYAIFMAASIILSGDHRKKRHVLHTGRQSKEAERENLQRLQQELLAKNFKQRNRSSKKTPKKFLRKSFEPKLPKKIHFLHIHKSAGTFLCAQAGRNKMATSHAMNCNVRDDQRCCWYNSEHESWNEKIDASNETKLVEESIRFAEKAPFDFVATERELAGPMLVDYYDYVVILRNSNARYHSHWLHLTRISQKRPRNGMVRAAKRQQIQQGMGVVQRVTTDQKKADSGDDPTEDQTHWDLTVTDSTDGSIHPVGNFTKWLDGQPDNYNLRMICGSPCVDVPKYQISRELFEHSLERLWVNFSHVMFKENIDESYARFAKAYKWKSKIVGGKRTIGAPTNATLTALHGDPLMTALDDALYELAQRKYKLTESNNSRLVWNENFAKFQNQDLVDLYFSEGPSRDCRNPCCGHCSKW